MRGTDAARARARRRTAFRALLAAVVITLAPPVWLSYDLMLRVTYLLAVGTVIAVLVRRRTRGETPHERYVRALRESTAMHVHLAGVRIAAVHPGTTSTRISVTWRSATTVLLDADGHPRGEVARNALSPGWTWSLPVDDAVAAGILACERGLGHVSVYGTTDVVREPGATLRDGRLVIDQYDLTFPSWSGSLLLDAELADRDS
jgi:hypothetical protein